MGARVVVEIRGGTLVGIFSNDPGIEARVVDWDDIKDAPEGYCAHTPVDPIEAMPPDTREWVEAASAHKARHSWDGTAPKQE